MLGSVRKKHYGKFNCMNVCILLLCVSSSSKQYFPCFYQESGLVLPVVSETSSRQRKCLGDDVHFASAVAMAISSKIRGVSATSDSGLSCSIAGSLSRHFKWSSPLSNTSVNGKQADSVRYEAFPSSNGFINFRCFNGDPQSSLLPWDRIEIPVAEVSPGLEAESETNSSPDGRRIGASDVNHLDIKMVPAAFDQESFELYRRYQVSHHRDDPNEVGKGDSQQ